MSAIAFVPCMQKVLKIASKCMMRTIHLQIFNKRHTRTAVILKTHAHGLRFVILCGGLVPSTSLAHTLHKRCSTYQFVKWIKTHLSNDFDIHGFIGGNFAFWFTEYAVTELIYCVTSLTHTLHEWFSGIGQSNHWPSANEVTLMNTGEQLWIMRS